MDVVARIDRVQASAKATRGDVYALHVEVDDLHVGPNGIHAHRTVPDERVRRMAGRDDRVAVTPRVD